MSRSNEDRIARWNERYARMAESTDRSASPLLASALRGVALGSALDIACGAGRHAIALAERGWRVVAVDASHVAVELMLRRAATRGCRQRIEAYSADLESEPAAFAIEPDSYDLIADFYYLHRPLLPAIRAGLRPGGIFVAAIHVGSIASAPPHRFLLEPGELERTVLGWGWRLLHYRELTARESGHEKPTAELVAERPRPHKQATR